MCSTGYRSTNSDGEVWGIWEDNGEYWRIMESTGEYWEFRNFGDIVECFRVFG